MVEQRRKMLRPIFFRLLAAVFAGLVLTVIAAQAVLWGSVLWLRTQDGEAWLKSSFAQLAAKSGYTLKIDSISGLTFLGVNIKSLSIADKDGLLLEAEKINLHVGVPSLFIGSVALSGGADSLILHRLPDSSGSSTSFSLPQTYFHALHINALNIKKLSLGAAVTGRAVEAAVRVSGEAAVHGQDISLFLSLKAAQNKDIALPEQIDVRAVFSPERHMMTVNKLAVVSKVYTFKGSGTADLHGGVLDFKIDAAAALPEGGMVGTIRVTGTSEKPAFSATGVIKRINAGELGDIHFIFISDDTLAGHADLATTWHKNDAVLGADFAYTDGTLRLQDIRGTAPGISVHGKATAALSAQNDLQSLEISLDHAAVDEVVIGQLDVTLTRAIDKAAYALSLDAKGVYQHPFSLKGTADLEGNAGEGMALRKIALVLHPSKGSMEVTGSMTRQDIALVLMLKSMTLGTLPLDVPDALAGLETTGSIHVNGPPAAPFVKAGLDFSPLRLRKRAPSVKLRLSTAYMDGKAVADISGQGHGIRTLRAHAEMPVTLSLYPFGVGGVQNTGLRADVAVDLELKSLVSAFLPTGTTLSGGMKADIKTSGAWDRPDMRGNLSWSGGRLTQAESGISFKGIEMRAVLEDRMLDIKSLHARDWKNGVFSAQGKLGFSEKNMPVDLSIQADRLVPFRASDPISGTFSGDISLKGDSRGYKAGGKITAGRVDITIPERFNRAIPTLNIMRRDAKDKPMPDFMKRVSLGLRLIAENQVFVRGWGLDAEFGGALDIGGTLDKPLYTGQFESKRGRYEEFGKRFELQHALLRFEGAVPPSPYLDVLAGTSVEDITAQITLTGNVSKPEVQLSSVPSLPQDEVLSRILFGKGMTKISPFQAIQLASTLRRFSGNGGGFEPLGMFRKATGLDDLQVERDEKGATTVGAGKYITDKVYLEAEAGSGESSGAAKVKIDLTPHVKAESKIGRDNKTGGGLMWQWDY
jgi:autotransporter translocation and assembly factor TamB